RKLAHVLDAAGHGHVDVAGADGAGRREHRLQPGTAQAVDADGVALGRDPGLDGAGPGDVGVLGDLAHAAHDHVLDALGLHPGAAQGLGDDHRTQVRGVRVAQRAAEGADGGAHAVDDDDLSHGDTSPQVTACSRVSHSGGTRRALTRRALQAAGSPNTPAAHRRYTAAGRAAPWPRPAGRSTIQTTIRGVSRGTAPPPSTPQHLAQHRLQDAAVAVVLDLHRRIQPGHGLEPHLAAVVAAGDDLHLAAGPDALDAPDLVGFGAVQPQGLGALALP